jgi:hypothetical protein
MIACGILYDAKKWFFNQVLGPEDEWEYKYSTTPEPCAQPLVSHTDAGGSEPPSGASTAASN